MMRVHFRATAFFLISMIYEYAMSSRWQVSGVRFPKERGESKIAEISFHGRIQQKLDTPISSRSEFFCSFLSPRRAWKRHAAAAACSGWPLPPAGQAPKVGVGLATPPCRRRRRRWPGQPAAGQGRRAPPAGQRRWVCPLVRRVGRRPARWRHAAPAGRCWRCCSLLPLAMPIHMTHRGACGRCCHLCAHAGASFPRDRSHRCSGWPDEHRSRMDDAR